MRKLVIGCGYLGRRVADSWKREGHEVYALTRSAATAEVLRAGGIVPILGDVTNSESLRALPEVDTTLYAVGFDRSAGHSLREVYVGGLTNALIQLKPRCRQLIFISSTSVYGQSSGEWVDEESPCEPTKPNGVVCRDAELAIEEILASAGSCEWQILRLAGIYGPGRLLQRVATMKAGTALSGNPESWLNLIHVDDAVATVHAAETQRADGITLVSDDRPIRRRAYYELLAALIGAPAPRFEESSNSDADQRELNKRCRNAKARTVWKTPFRFPTIDEGLPHALADTLGSTP